jgi:hypothetical protein
MATTEFLPPPLLQLVFGILGEFEVAKISQVNELFASTKLSVRNLEWPHCHKRQRPLSCVLRRINLTHVQHFRSMLSGCPERTQQVSQLLTNLSNLSSISLTNFSGNLVFPVGLALSDLSLSFGAEKQLPELLRALNPSALRYLSLRLTDFTQAIYDCISSMTHLLDIDIYALSRSMPRNEEPTSRVLRNAKFHEVLISELCSATCLDLAGCLRGEVLVPACVETLTLAVRWHGKLEFQSEQLQQLRLVGTEFIEPKDLRWKPRSPQTPAIRVIELTLPWSCLRNPNFCIELGSTFVKVACLHVVHDVPGRSHIPLDAFMGYWLREAFPNVCAVIQQRCPENWPGDHDEVAQCLRSLGFVASVY